jgi:hypothetical protein
MPKLRNDAKKTRRNKQNKKKKTRKHKLSANHRSAAAKETPQEPAAINTYSSSYASNMRNIVVDTKINDQPIEHKVFTIRNLRKENPLGADLIITYLNGNVPETLQNPSTDTLPHIHIQPVLTSLSDLGLNHREAAINNHEPSSNINSIHELQLDIHDIGNNERFPINQLPVIPSPKTTIM